jgi:hypothetical protein
MHAAGFYLLVGIGLFLLLTLFLMIIFEQVCYNSMTYNKKCDNNVTFEYLIFELNFKNPSKIRHLLKTKCDFFATLPESPVAFRFPIVTKM